MKHLSTSQGGSNTDSFTLVQALAVAQVQFPQRTSSFHPSSMRVSISTLNGVEVARLDTDATATLVDLLALLPNEVDDIDCSRRIFFGETELQGHTNLSDIGVIEGSVLTVVFVPILRFLTASEDKTAKVWSAASGARLLTLEGHTSQVNSAVFSPDGQQVLTASVDGTAKVWSAASGACLLTLVGHEDWINSAGFSPDGQQVLTASEDGTAKVWSAASGECLRTLMGHTRQVNSAVFSPDGQQVLTASRRQDREGVVGCLGCMLAHLGWATNTGSILQSSRPTASRC